MSMYEAILEILEKKGPRTFPVICHELNQLPVDKRGCEKTVQLSQVKNVIRRKKDLFIVQDNVVYIDPEKEMIRLEFSISEGGGALRSVKVYFLEGRFDFFDWSFDISSGATAMFPSQPEVGNIESFKKELYRIGVWKWQTDYQCEGIVLDSTIWSVKLVTKGKIYQSEGIQRYPKEWKKLCLELTKLTGVKIM